ncbi:unnamed protein product, partial [Brassica oleracea]
VVRDIQCISRSCNFTFHYASRSLLESVDNIAKQAKICKQKYVVIWFV